MMPLEVIQGEALTEDQIVAEAYAPVAEGYMRALAVRGLPAVEVECLQACLRAAHQICLDGGARCER